MKQKNWTTSCAQNESERVRETLIWPESVTEKETGNVHPGACVDVLPRCCRWRTCDSAAILFHCLPSLSRVEIVKNSSYPSHGNQLQFLLACIVYSRPLPSARARIGEKSLLRYFLRGGGSCTHAKLLHVGNRRIFTSGPVNHVETYNWHVIAKPFNRVTWNSFISRGTSVTWERGI